MEAKYRETQSGLWIVVLTIVAGSLPVYQILNKDESPFTNWVVLTTAAIILLVGFLFYNLKTSVFRDKIKLTFGIGIVYKNIDISAVKNVEVVRNKWIYGWGIRFIFNGWMWNIYGLDAVELSFHHKKNIFRIGSQNPIKLKEKIEEMTNN